MMINSVIRDLLSRWARLAGKPDPNDLAKMISPDKKIRRLLAKFT
jgi:hypothetical protein